MAISMKFKPRKSPLPSFPNRKRGIIISGQEQVIANLNKEIRKLEARNRAGMTEAALIVKRESMIRTPVEWSNLKNDHYIDIYEQPGHGIIAEVGTGVTVSKEYAVYVHENLEARHIVGQARFLATALVVKAAEVLEAIKRHAQIK